MVVIPAKSDFISRSIDMAFGLFPHAYKKKMKYHHFSMIWERSKLLAIGQNDMGMESGKALRFAKRFKTSTEHPYIHAEISAISKLWSRVYVNSSLKMVVIRLNSFGELGESKPCKNCQTILDALGLRKVYWTTRDQEIHTYAKN